MAVDSASILALALRAVAAKVVIILGLAICAGLYSWAMWEHTYIALAIASSFALIVFLPLLFRVLSNGDSHAEDR
jgi:hypothetical protein